MRNVILRKKKKGSQDSRESINLNNQLRRKTDRAKELYMEETCDEIMNLQRIGRYLMYPKAQKLGRRTTKTIKTFEIKVTYLLIDEPL
jgi:hypothetical protein